MFENISNSQKAIIAVVVLVVLAISWSTIQQFVNENQTASAVIATAVIVAIIAYYWFRRPEKITFLDPKTAALLFFTQTKTGDDILVHFNVERRVEGTVPMLNFGKCEFPIRMDGVGAVVGKMFPNDDTEYILILDLKNRKVSDDNTNLVHFGYAFLDLKDYEKELDRINPSEKSPFEKAAQKLLHDKMLKKAEDFMEEI